MPKILIIEIKKYTSAGVQPIGKAAKVVRPDVVNVGTNLQTGADAASKYTN